MAKEYCPHCGGYHEPSTGGCASATLNEYHYPLIKISSTMDKLDEIIRLLEKIEYYLRTKS